MTQKTKGFILGDFEGTELTQEDREILAHPKLAGVIIFARNYDNPDQLKSLTKAIHELRSDFIISVDQEGGRVQRFKNAFTSLPPLRHWGELYQEDKTLGQRDLAAMTRVMANELKSVGVNFDLVPVLDLDHKLSSVIGDRSFSGDPLVVTQLAKTLIDTLHENGFPVIGKHFPGHGGVRGDSHDMLPVDTREYKHIFSQDMQPFVQLAADLDAVMPAHVIYEDVDPLPTTYSSRWLKDILRDELRFEGVVISDDLSMAGAAQFDAFVDRALAAQAAGCDILSICNNREALVDLLDASGLRSNSVSNERIQTLLTKLH